MKVFHASGQPGFMLENFDSGSNWNFQVNSGTGSLMLFNNAFGGGFPAGIFATNGVYTPSDKRLKKDIATIPSILDKVLKLSPVSYRYTPEASNSNRSVGFLAQDVQALFPELVTQTPMQNGTAYLGLNYAGFGVLAIKAVQEQQGQIESLRTENARLRDQLNDLVQRLQHLEQHAGVSKK